MIQKTRLTAAFVFCGALATAGAALAQAKPASATPPPSAQPATADAQSPPWDRSKPIPPPTISPTDTSGNQPTYSVSPPPGDSSGVYLPAAVLGYAKSAAGCVVVGCNDGPEVSPPSSTTSGPGAATPPSSRPTNKGS
jgi:hypothetical protein